MSSIGTVVAFNTAPGELLKLGLLNAQYWHSIRLSGGRVRVTLPDYLLYLEGEEGEVRLYALASEQPLQEIEDLYAQYVGTRRRAARQKLLPRVLESLEGVDGGRIGAMGISMGSGHSWLSAMVEPRIRALVGVSSFYTYKALYAPPIQHCFMNHLPHVTEYGLETYDLFRLIAPRPFLMINGTTEPQGVMVASGTTSVNFTGATSIGNYESLLFSVPKAQRPMNSQSVRFCATETSYQRARAAPWCERSLSRTIRRSMSSSAATSPSS